MKDDPIVRYKHGGKDLRGYMVTDLDGDWVQWDDVCSVLEQLEKAEAELAEVNKELNEMKFHFRADEAEGEGHEV